MLITASHRLLDLLYNVGEMHCWAYFDVEMDRQMFDFSIYADASDQPSLLVPIVRATPETVVGFGKLVPDYDAEEVIRVTWPKAGWRPILPGTGNHQVRVTSSQRTDVCTMLRQCRRKQRFVGNCSIFRRFDIPKVLLGRLGLGLGSV